MEKNTGRAVTSVVVFLLLLINLSLSAFRVYERENVIHAKAEIADVIAAWCGRDGHSAQRLFIPFSTPYIISEFAAYLTYRGIYVEGDKGAADRRFPNQVVIASSNFAKDGRCVDYLDFTCHAEGDRVAGDLIIQFPDDLESASEIDKYRTGGMTLLSYAPRPRIERWMHPFLGYLHVASAPFWSKSLPDGWLRASVTLWK